MELALPNIRKVSSSILKIHSGLNLNCRSLMTPENGINIGRSIKLSLIKTIYHLLTQTKITSGILTKNNSSNKNSMIQIRKTMNNIEQDVYSFLH